MKGPRTGLIVADLFALTGSYVFMAGLKPVMVSYLSPRYLIGFGITLFLWLFSSFYFKKYHITKKDHPRFLMRNIAIPNLVALAFVSFIIYAFNTTFYSRMMVFGTFGVATFLDWFVFTTYAYLLRSPDYDIATSYMEMPPTAGEKRRIKEAVTHSEIHPKAEELRNAIIEEVGEKAERFIENHVELEGENTLIISTLTRFNILKQEDHRYSTIVNLRRINDIRYLNKFFESVNHKLPQHGVFIGWGETAHMRMKRILQKYPPVLNWIIFLIDYLIKRVFPKFYVTRGIYFFLTRGNNRVLTRAEILGRLYACGFEIIEDQFVNGTYFFVGRRIKKPAFDPSPTYGPFITLRRVGKGGERIKVYKLRTMYPFAEYLQDYIHKQNSLENGGKFRNDFRVSGSRAVLRKLWIDELPMIINVLRGELKVVGVRPLSQHYFNLYSKELQEKRIKYKPGLIPPYYADLPETLEEIQESELRYLESYEKRPFRTQWKYFWRAWYNILFRKARSA